MAFHHGSREVLSRGRRDDWIASGDNYQQELFKRLNRLNFLDLNRFDAHPVPRLRPGHRRHERGTFAQVERAMHPFDNFTESRSYEVVVNPRMPKSVVLLGDSVPNPWDLPPIRQNGCLFVGGLRRPAFRPLSRRSGCGRDEHRCPPPAQIRTSGITAYGSSLGYERRSVHRDKGEECGDEESIARR